MMICPESKYHIHGRIFKVIREQEMDSVYSLHDNYIYKESLCVHVLMYNNLHLKLR